MANISGNVLFNVSNTIPTSGNPVANIPIVLRNTTTGVGLTVLTSSGGVFSFNNVPNATYSLVESWGTIGGVPSPGNFSNATVINAPTPKDPPISSMPSPPSEANAVQSLTPNTVDITISGSDVTNTFIDGPIYIEANSSYNVIKTGPNLITAAANGTWGTLPAGSLANQSPASAPYSVPYPGIAPNYAYAQAGPISPPGGSYSVSNTNSRNIYTGTIWNISDRITGDETGRFQMVAGTWDGGVFFSQSVALTPNTTYYVNFWMCNLVNNQIANFPLPLVKIVGDFSSIIYTETFSGVPTITIPMWKEYATTFNSGSNSQVLFQLARTGPVGTGNELAVDDIALYSAVVVPRPTFTKAVNKSSAVVGENLIYTIVLNNTTQDTATNIIFSDTIPDGTNFVANSINLNGTTMNGATITLPNGFSVGTLPINQVSTVTFSVFINTLPNTNPIINEALLTYSFISNSTLGLTTTVSFSSNTTSTKVNSVSLGVLNKSVDKAFCDVNGIITYTIIVKNTGNITANNLIISDTIPTDTSFVEGSVFINNVANSTTVPIVI